MIYGMGIAIDLIVIWLINFLNSFVKVNRKFEIITGFVALLNVANIVLIIILTFYLEAAILLLPLETGFIVNASVFCGSLLLAFLVISMAELIYNENMTEGFKVVCYDLFLVSFMSFLVIPLFIFFVLA